MNLRNLNNKQPVIPRISYARWMKGTLLIILLAVSVLSCKNDFENIKKFSNIAALPDLTAEGYEVLYSDSMVIRYKIQTPQMVIYNNQKDPYTEFPIGVIITQYDSKMNITSHITSRYAKYFEEDDRWEAKNDVVAINPKGDTLKTEYLVWDRKKGKIFSDQFVKIIQKDQVTTGTSFESNQDFSEYTFKNLKGQMYIDVQEK
ncbi:MAG: LPS export ABC transporter periplasmic protein LptC [Verrucomicrobia bacterium]|nr:LPS export ABC transporter periplasmic protein LptC [Prolixibacteraceae bacterium]